MIEIILHLFWVMFVFFFVWMIVGLLIDSESFTLDNPRIDFSDFQKWYALAPQKWDIECDEWNLVKRIDLGELYRFGFLDGLRFRVWKKRQKKASQRKQELEAVASLLEAVQEDIDACREKAGRELDEATRTVQRVSENPNPYAPIKEWLKLYNSIHKC